MNLILELYHTDTLILDLKRRQVKLDAHLFSLKKVQIAHTIIIQMSN